MKSLNFFRSVSAWGHILFAILRVLAIIGAVFTVIGIFTFSLLPRDFFSIDVSMQTDMKFNFKALLGENWSEIVKDAEDVVYDSLPDGSKLTEDGIEISEITPSTTVRGKTLALEMIPAFTQMLISIALFHYLCNQDMAHLLLSLHHDIHHKDVMLQFYLKLYFELLAPGQSHHNVHKSLVLFQV